MPPRLRKRRGREDRRRTCERRRRGHDEADASPIRLEAMRRLRPWATAIRRVGRGSQLEPARADRSVTKRGPRADATDHGGDALALSLFTAGGRSEIASM